MTADLTTDALESISRENATAHAALDAANVARVTGDEPRYMSLDERIALLIKDRDESRTLLGDTAHRLANEEQAHQGALEYGAAEHDRAERLIALINTPRTDDFFESVRNEATHQILRWGVEHDAGKRPEDWIALFMYLLGKATKAHYESNRAKLEHHVITVAAVALNWHRSMTGVSTAMRPGLAPRPMRCICGHTHREHDMQDTTACGGDSDGRRCQCVQWSLNDMHLFEAKEA